MKDIDDVIIDRINKQRKQDEIDKITNLRDEFAKYAMNGYLANPNDGFNTIEESANFCYELADAMLKARQQ